FPDKVYLSDGRISIPSMKGPLVFHPDSIPAKISSGKLFIEKVVVDDNKVNDLSDVYLSPDYSTMSISLSTPWRTKAETLKFEWRIAGRDTRWIPVRHDEDVNIRNYGYGNYALALRIKGYPRSEITYHFRVQPYFY